MRDLQSIVAVNDAAVSSFNKGKALRFAAAVLEDFARRKQGMASGRNAESTPAKHDLSCAKQARQGAAALRKQALAERQGGEG